MTISFNLELKTGFFETEMSEVAIDSHNKYIRIEKNFGRKSQTSASFDLIHFSDIQKITFNPLMNDEIEIMTSKNAYIGCIYKEAIEKGVVDFVKLSFGDKFREIR